MLLLIYHIIPSYLGCMYNVVTLSDPKLGIHKERLCSTWKYITVTFVFHIPMRKMFSTIVRDF